jgi:hypothetical protein
MRDERASPLTFRGPGIIGYLAYVREGINYKHILDLSLNADLTNSEYEEYHCYGIRGYLRYNYYLKVFNSTNTDNKFDFYIGGGLSSFMNFSFFFENSFVNQVTNHLATTWYFIHSAELSLLLDYRYKTKNYFKLRLIQPLVSNVSRPQYAMETGTLNNLAMFDLFGKNSFFWEYTDLQVQITYKRLINEWLDLSLDFCFQYSSYPYPRWIKLYSNYLLAGVHFKF